MEKMSGRREVGVTALKVKVIPRTVWAPAGLLACVYSITPSAGTTRASLPKTAAASVPG